MRRGAAARAAASTPAPDPGGANIYSQQLLSREEGGGRPVARGPGRLLPIPHRDSHSPHSSGSAVSPQAHTSWGSPLPTTQTPTWQQARGLGSGEFDLWASRDSSRGSNLAKCPLSNLQLLGAGKGGGPGSQDTVRIELWAARAVER